MIFKPFSTEKHFALLFKTGYDRVSLVLYYNRTPTPKGDGHVKLPLCEYRSVKKNNNCYWYMLNFFLTQYYFRFVIW